MLREILKTDIANVLNSPYNTNWKDATQKK